MIKYGRSYFCGSRLVRQLFPELLRLLVRLQLYFISIPDFFFLSGSSRYRNFFKYRNYDRPQIRTTRAVKNTSVHLLTNTTTCMYVCITIHSKEVLFVASAQSRVSMSVRLFDEGFFTRIQREGIHRWLMGKITPYLPRIQTTNYFLNFRSFVFDYAQQLIRAITR